MKRRYVGAMNLGPYRSTPLRPFVIGGALLWGVFECVALWRNRLLRRS